MKSKAQRTPVIAVASILILIAACLVILDARHARRSEGVHVAEGPSGTTPSSGGEPASSSPRVRVQISTPASTEPVERSVSEVTIRVHSIDGSTVPDAVVGHHDEHPSERTDASALRRTDHQGRCSLNVDFNVRSRLRVSASGFSDATISIGPEHRSDSSEVVVTLYPQASLLGRVRWADSTPVPGARVRAWPSSYTAPSEFSFDQVSAVECLETTCGDDGAFRIVGAKSGVRYTVTALGSGGVARSRVKTIAAPNAFADIVLDRVFATRVVWRLPQGEALARVSVAGPIVSFPQGLGTRSILKRGSELGALVGRSTSEVSWNERIVGCHLQADSDRIGPFRVRGAIAGYEPYDEQVWALPLQGEEMATHEIRLEPTAPGFGSLAILLTEPLDCFDALDLETSSVLGDVVLSSVSNTDEIRIGLPRDGDGLFVAEGIPWGNYRARFEDRDGLWRFPEIGRDGVDVVVSEDDAFFHIENPPLGALTLALTDRDGALLEGDGPLNLMFEYRDPSGASRSTQGSLTLHGTPLLFGPVPAGEYRLRNIGAWPAECQQTWDWSTVSPNTVSGIVLDCGP